MLKTTISIEFLKLKRSRLWIIAFFIPLICIFLGLLNFSANHDALVSESQNEWIQAWTQVGMLYAMLLYPILISVYCALICRQERQSNNWQKLCSLPVPFQQIYWAKFFTISILSFFTQMFFMISFLFIGKLAGIQSSIPWETILNWVYTGWIGSLSVASIQLLLSSIIKSFALPIGIGVGLTFAGIVFYMFNLGLLWPMSHPAVAMDPIRLQGLDNAFLFIIFHIISLLFILMTSYLGIRWFTQKDISN
ncbi:MULTISPECIES: ABC transporter permease [Bacillus cereus group]|uniref:Permease n=1 Tax=Bacillus cereus TaxID=1396 RepID=A0A2A8IT42_BACCE|nr:MULTISPECIES: ABC transporter permease [Bacillus cereus group]PER22609.1 permease [Bacillus cereus]PGU01616.1 permease [Bacillus cereus]